MSGIVIEWIIVWLHCVWISFLWGTLRRKEGRQQGRTHMGVSAGSGTRHRGDHSVEGCGAETASCIFAHK